LLVGDDFLRKTSCFGVIKLGDPVPGALIRSIKDNFSVQRSRLLTDSKTLAVVS